MNFFRTRKFVETPAVSPTMKWRASLRSHRIGLFRLYGAAHGILQIMLSHMGIGGHDIPDRCTKQALTMGIQTISPNTPETTPTASGLARDAGGSYEKLRKIGGRQPFRGCRTGTCRQWLPRDGPQYTIGTSQELHLPRPLLHRRLAMRSYHGDFRWYYENYRHSNTRLTCSCSRSALMTSLKAVASPTARAPTTKQDTVAYLDSLRPKDFQALLEIWLLQRHMSTVIQVAPNNAIRVALYTVWAFCSALPLPLLFLVIS